MAREDEVRLIAYHIWEEQGCPNGRDCEHWYVAETIWEERQKPAASKKKAEPAKAPAASQKSPRPSAKR